MIDQIKEAEACIAKEQWDEALSLLNRCFDNDVKNTHVLEMRAEVFHKLNRIADAVNDLNRLLKIEPGNDTIKARKELLQTILKNSQLDVYACTNTHLDPWT
jgi:tetratricopeptide (TPR) repeat protein